MTNLLLETDLKGEQREYAETARASGEALLGVINDILDFSKIEAGRLDFETLDFDLQEIVESTIDLVTERAQSKGLELTFFVHHDVPRMLAGDPGRLRQVLLNLLSNAVKFTAEGEVSLEVSRQKETASEATLLFSIRDTGIGLTAAAVAKIFQPFLASGQLDDSPLRRHRSWPRDLQPARRENARSDQRRKRTGSGFHLLLRRAARATAGRRNSRGDSFREGRSGFGRQARAHRC
jgi:K+-sensing histidine kinase KdpD